MTQAHAATLPQIIDLTDDNDEQLANLSAAASNAAAAATRLTTQFEALTSTSQKRPFCSKPIGNGQISAQRKDIKKFVKKTFDQKVPDYVQGSSRASNSSALRHQEGSSSSTVSSSSNELSKSLKARPDKISNLSEYLRRLEDETLPTDLDDFKTTLVHRQDSPIREPSSGLIPISSASGGRFDQSVYQQGRDRPHPTVGSPDMSNAARTPIDLDPPPEIPFFAPGFDRGRFPAQRRRRGNKYYNPERTPAKPIIAKSIQSINVENHRPSTTPSTSAYSPNPSSDESGDTEEITHDSFVARVATDPELKALIKLVATGKASTSQTQAFYELTEEGHYCQGHRQHSSFFTEAETRKLATSHDPRLERLVANLILNQCENPLAAAEKTRQYSVIISEREELVTQPDMIKNVHRNAENKASSLTRIETKVIDPAWNSQRSTASMLRHREIGSDSRGRHIESFHELRLRNVEKIEPWRYWKGASGDIVAAAWHPNSTTYAVGAAAQTNPEDVQYNRPCNLLLGDLISNNLYELPDHRVNRPRPETLANTYNARQAVYDACDPMVYETVSSIAFSPTADRMYTASNDCTVKIWDTKKPQQTCLRTLYHDAKVISVEASTHKAGLFATGSDTPNNPVRIYYAAEPEDSLPFYIGFHSSRAQAKPDSNIYPECIRWGLTPHTSHLLLAGFRQKGHEDEENSRDGQLCLWDANACEFTKVVPSSQAVFAAAWHPNVPFFATGGSPGGNQLTDKHTTKTVVRTWDLRSPRHYTMEYECTASDMQDITFHPTDSNIVTAGCTDGTSFVWDYRWPNHPLHRLRHGFPLVNWDHTRGNREDVDTGVMMSVWGLGGSLFYTGSSDGMIKAWDVRRHPQDVLVRNVAQFGAGIQSGAISPDGTNMLVGDADGGVHVLSSAPCGRQPEQRQKAEVSPEVPITLIRAPSGSGLALSLDDNDNPGVEGQLEAKRLTETGQLSYDTDFGVTQGEAYNGPFAHKHRQEAADAFTTGALTEGNAESKQFFLRTRQENKEVEAMRRNFIADRKQSIAMLYPALAA
ncbi:hypothetical protein ACLMJK_002104 [Lecanora helva]